MPVSYETSLKAIQAYLKNHASSQTHTLASVLSETTDQPASVVKGAYFSSLSQTINQVTLTLADLFNSVNLPQAKKLFKPRHFLSGSYSRATELNTDTAKLLSLIMSDYFGFDPLSQQELEWIIHLHRHPDRTRVYELRDYFLTKLHNAWNATPLDQRLTIALVREIDYLLRTKLSTHALFELSELLTYLDRDANFNAALDVFNEHPAYLQLLISVILNSGNRFQVKMIMYIYEHPEKKFNLSHSQEQRLQSFYSEISIGDRVCAKDTEPFFEIDGMPILFSTANTDQSFMTHIVHPKNATNFTSFKKYAVWKAELNLPVSLTLQNINEISVASDVFEKALRQIYRSTEGIFPFFQTLLHQLHLRMLTMIQIDECTLPLLQLIYIDAASLLNQIAFIYLRDQLLGVNLNQDFVPLLNIKLKALAESEKIKKLVKDVLLLVCRHKKVEFEAIEDVDLIPAAQSLSWRNCQILSNNTIRKTLWDSSSALFSSREVDRKEKQIRLEIENPWYNHDPELKM